MTEHVMIDSIKRLTVILQSALEEMLCNADTHITIIYYKILYILYIYILYNIKLIYYI